MVHSRSIDVHSILVFTLRCRAEGDQHENFAITPIAITLMGCTVLNVTAKSAPVLNNAEHNRTSKVTIPATTPFTVKFDQVVSAKTSENGGGFTGYVQ